MPKLSATNYCASSSFENEGAGNEMDVMASNSRKKSFMGREYVEKQNGDYYITGSRISLEPIVCQFVAGASPESILDDFPSLSLEQVYASLLFISRTGLKLMRILPAPKNGAKRRVKINLSSLTLCANDWSGRTASQPPNGRENQVPGGPKIEGERLCLGFDAEHLP